MKKYKQHFSILLYILSITIMMGVGTDAILISEKFIEAEKNVNIYGLIYFYQFLILSIILWGISYFLYPNTKLNIAFWAMLFIITTLVML